MLAKKAHSRNYHLVPFKKIYARRPDIRGPSVKVWTIKQDSVIRINLVEMSGELRLHQHPDAEHTLMVLQGKVKVKAGQSTKIIRKGDFISIAPGVPHKYWTLTKNALLVSMDAPYYDPKKTIALE